MTPKCRRKHSRHPCFGGRGRGAEGRVGLRVLSGDPLARRGVGPTRTAKLGPNDGILPLLGARIHLVGHAQPGQ